jgi:hypothetical protein
LPLAKLRWKVQKIDNARIEAALTPGHRHPRSSLQGFAPATYQPARFIQCSGCKLVATVIQMPQVVGQTAEHAQFFSSRWRDSGWHRAVAVGRLHQRLHGKQGCRLHAITKQELLTAGNCSSVGKSQSRKA